MLSRKKLQMRTMFECAWTAVPCIGLFFLFYVLHIRDYFITFEL